MKLKTIEPALPKDLSNQCQTKKYKPTNSDLKQINTVIKPMGTISLGGFHTWNDNFRVFANGWHPYIPPKINYTLGVFHKSITPGNHNFDILNIDIHCLKREPIGNPDIALDLSNILITATRKNKIAGEPCQWVAAFDGNGKASFQNLPTDAYYLEIIALGEPKPSSPIWCT